jgi:hypothetical protein
MSWCSGLDGKSLNQSKMGGNLNLSSGIIEAEVQVDVSKSSLAARV